MADTITLKTEPRHRAGKGGARATRREGRIPAIIYGNNQAPTMVAVDANALGQQLRKPGFFAHVVELDLGTAKERVLPRDVQLDPVTDRPLHVDFLRFSAATRVNVEVQVKFDNEDKAPGLKQGGVLNIVLHTLELICRPDAIPESVRVDLTGLGIGDVVHVNQVALPADVELGDYEEDATVATIAAPSTEEVAEAAEPAEGEEAAASE